MIRSRGIQIISVLFTAAALPPASVPARAQAPYALPTRHIPSVVASGRATLLRPMSPSRVLSISAILPIRNQAALHDLLRAVNDPSSPNYRRVLTPQQSTARFSPTVQQYQAVAEFLESRGMIVTRTWPNRMLIDLKATAAQIDRTFHTTLGIYEFSARGTFFAPEREPTVSMSVPLWHIGGLSNYAIPRPMVLHARAGAASNTTGSGPSGNFTGSDRRAAYYGQSALNGAGQTVGLFELDGYSANDVEDYFSYLGQTLDVPVENVLVDGAGAGSDGNDTEQVLDIAVAASMAPGLSQVRVYIGPLGGFIPGVTDADIFNTMAGEDTAKQISVSWQWQDESNADHPIFQEMDAQSQNVFVASGDNGSYPSSLYAGYYPAEDSAVVAIGGTTLTTSSAGGPWKSETAWGTNNTLCSTHSSSGGGVAPDDVPIPSYQQLSGVINSSNGGSTQYRNVPDVAAEANCDNYYYANGAPGTGNGGTSFAAPTWAGYLALANQQALSNGGGPIPFINPTAYRDVASDSIALHFNFIDITSGTNGSYNAVTGYDLVTGWGSPNGCDLITTLATTSSCQAPAGSPSPTGLSLVSRYDQPATESDTLTNNGPGTITIYSVSASGSYFYVSNNGCPTYLPQGSHCTVQVTFNPGGCVAPQHGTLVYSDDGSGGGQQVSLSGQTLDCTTKPSGAPAP